MNTFGHLTMAHRYLYYVKKEPIVDDKTYDDFTKMTHGMPENDDMPKENLNLPETYDEECMKVLHQITNRKYLNEA